MFALRKLLDAFWQMLIFHLIDFSSSFNFLKDINKLFVQSHFWFFKDWIFRVKNTEVDDKSSRLSHEKSYEQKDQKFLVKESIFNRIFFSSSGSYFH